MGDSLLEAAPAPPPAPAPAAVLCAVPHHCGWAGEQLQLSGFCSSAGVPVSASSHLPGSWSWSPVFLGQEPGQLPVSVPRIAAASWVLLSVPCLQQQLLLLLLLHCAVALRAGTWGSRSRFWNWRRGGVGKYPARLQALAGAKRRMPWLEWVGLDLVWSAMGQHGSHCPGHLCCIWPPPSYYPQQASRT